MHMAAALHDKNGDGVLNSDEFAELISAVTGKQDAFLGNGRSGRDILQMYSDAIHVRYALSLSLSISPRAMHTQHERSTISMCRAEVYHRTIPTAHSDAHSHCHIWQSTLGHISYVVDSHMAATFADLMRS